MSDTVHFTGIISVNPLNKLRGHVLLLISYLLMGMPAQLGEHECQEVAHLDQLLLWARYPVTSQLCAVLITPVSQMGKRRAGLFWVPWLACVQSREQSLLSRPYRCPIQSLDHLHCCTLPPRGGPTPLLSQRGPRDRGCGQRAQTANLLEGLLGEELPEGGRRWLGVTLRVGRWSSELKVDLGRTGLHPGGPGPLFPVPVAHNQGADCSLGTGPCLSVGPLVSSLSS